MKTHSSPYTVKSDPPNPHPYLIEVGDPATTTAIVKDRNSHRYDDETREWEDNVDCIIRAPKRRMFVSPDIIEWRRRMVPIEENPMNDFIHAPMLLDWEEQKEIYHKIMEIPEFYNPVTRWGANMNILINCLGQHWNATNYTYMPTREDYDHKPAASIPDWLQNYARKIMDETGYWDGDYIPFDVCICNWYEEKTGKLGLHQDNSESRKSIATGYPILSVSIGADCVFQIGGVDKKEKIESIILHSGDVALFGRSKRLAFHGVSKVIPGTTPGYLEMPPGRLNLTFRIS